LPTMTSGTVSVPWTLSVSKCYITNLFCGDGGVAYQVIEDFISNDADHFERCFGTNRVHEHVAMNANKVLGLHDAVFVLLNFSMYVRVKG
jgi:hypothetical protein